MSTTQLIDALEQRFEDLLNSFHSVGTVTAVAAPRATVNIAGQSVTLGYLSTYTPAVNDVVQVIGRPGAQFIAGKLT